MGGRSQAGREELRSFAAFPKAGAARTRRRPPKEGCKWARSRRRCARVCRVTSFHSDKDCRCGGCESRSAGLVPCFHSISVETPSPSWSRWAKPGIRVSMPCSRAQVSGMPSGEIWHSWSDSLCSIPMMKSLARCACDAAETIIRGSFSSFSSPRGEVGGRVLEPHRVQNAGLVRQERRAEFGDQLLLGIPLRTESRLLRDALPVQTGAVT